MGQHWSNYKKDQIVIDSKILSTTYLPFTSPFYSLLLSMIVTKTMTLIFFYYIAN